MTKLLTGFVLLACASAASASSPGAWAAFDREVAQRCTAASKLEQAHAVRPVGFDDTLGKVVTLVSGRERVKVRGGFSTVATQKLCVYDQRTKRTWVAETPGWHAG